MIYDIIKLSFHYNDIRTSLFFHDNLVESMVSQGYYDIKIVLFLHDIMTSPQNYDSIMKL